MTLYNTLTRKKEEFMPQDPPTVRFYSCGPTVYSTAHIGNLRTYLFNDWLRRTLRFAGYATEHVMNITDVGHLTDDGDDGEDKLEKAAREKKIDPWAIAAAVTETFFRDCAALNIERPETVCKATAHIPQMLDFTKKLLEKGHAYETPDGIYFDISTFPGYGKLSGIDLDAQQAGARVEVNPHKRHPADFALWKHAPREHIMQWESPWGMGYPGWHIECSALCLQYLGERIDIHTGGVDHIPVHHENEIAQSEALLGHPAVNIWMHGEFMLINGGKMSKSLGNLYTLDDLQKRGFEPRHFRYFCAGAHYRNKLNFTWDALEAAKVSYERLVAAIHSHKGGNDNLDVAEYIKQMHEAVLDDLNIPKAMGALWSMIRQSGHSQAVYDAVMDIDRVLGLFLDRAPSRTDDGDIPEEARALIAERALARERRDYALSDKLRDRLLEMGIEVKDTKDGTVISKK